MKSYLTVGSAPAGENCAQVGTEGYVQAAIREGRAYIGQLRRHYKAQVGHDFPCRLIVQSHPHDFGFYYEVNVVYQDEEPHEVMAVLWLTNNSPELWDQTAKDELGISE